MCSCFTPCSLMLAANTWASKQSVLSLLDSGFVEWLLWCRDLSTEHSVVNTGEYYGLVGPGESHLMKTTDQWPLTGRASPVSPCKCLKWKEPSSVFQLLSPGKVPKKTLETRLEATPVKYQCRVRKFHYNSISVKLLLAVKTLVLLSISPLSQSNSGTDLSLGDGIGVGVVDSGVSGVLEFTLILHCLWSLAHFLSLFRSCLWHFFDF